MPKQPITADLINNPTIILLESNKHTVDWRDKNKEAHNIADSMPKVPHLEHNKITVYAHHVEKYLQKTACIFIK